MPECFQNIDESILFFIQQYIKCPALDRVMVFITALGNAGLFWIAAAFLFMLVKRYQKCGFMMLCTIKLAKYIGDELIKPFVGRVRPCNKFTEVPLLIHAPHSPSFPSGHTMVGFACATVIFYFDKRLGTVGFVVAALIAFSRLYLFVHYPSDVLGGILYGVLCSVVLVNVMRAIYHKLKRTLSKPTN